MTSVLETATRQVSVVGPSELPLQDTVGRLSLEPRGVSSTEMTVDGTIATQAIVPSTSNRLYAIHFARSTTTRGDAWYNFVPSGDWQVARGTYGIEIMFSGDSTALVGGEAVGWNITMNAVRAGEAIGSSSYALTPAGGVPVTWTAGTPSTLQVERLWFTSDKRWLWAEPDAYIHTRISRLQSDGYTGTVYLMGYRYIMRPELR